MMLSVESSGSSLSTAGKGRKRAPETLRPVCTEAWIVDDGENSVVVDRVDVVVGVIVVDGDAGGSSVDEVPDSRMPIFLTMICCE